jgi:hypothetical protein
MARVGLLDEMVEYLVDDVFEVGEEPIDRRRETRSIEATVKPGKHVLKFSCNGTDAVDVLVVAVEKAAQQFWWLVVSCSPRRRRGEHVEPFKKLEGEVLKQREHFCGHDIEKRFSKDPLAGSLNTCHLSVHPDRWCASHYMTSSRTYGADTRLGGHRIQRWREIRVVKACFMPRLGRW